MQRVEARRGEGGHAVEGADRGGAGERLGEGSEDGRAREAVEPLDLARGREEEGAKPTEVDHERQQQHGDPWRDGKAEAERGKHDEAAHEHVEGRGGQQRVAELDVLGEAVEDAAERVGVEEEHRRAQQPQQRGLVDVARRAHREAEVQLGAEQREAARERQQGPPRHAQE